MMRWISADFFAQSPVLIGPIIALGIFFAVFVAVSARTFLKKKTHFDPVSRLPLDGED